MEDAIRSQGYHLLVTSYDVIPDCEESHLRAFAAKPVAGVISCPSFNSRPEEYARLLEEGIPLVLVDTKIEDLAADFVGTDDFWTAHAGTKALLQSGCGRIAYLAGYRMASTTRERLAGCQLALSEVGKELPPELIMTGEFTEEFGYSATCRILAEHPEVDAFFVANDPLSVGVVRALQEHNRWLPICSYDEPEVPYEWAQSMVLLKQQRYAVGYSAGEMLLRRIDGMGSPPSPVASLSIKADVVMPTNDSIPTLCGSWLNSKANVAPSWAAHQAAIQETGNIERR